MMMADISKDRGAHSLKKRGSVSSLSSHESRWKDLRGHIKDLQPLKGIHLMTHTDTMGKNVISVEMGNDTWRRSSNLVDSVFKPKAFRKMEVVLDLGHYGWCYGSHYPSYHPAKYNHTSNFVTESCVSTVSHMDEPSQRDVASRLTVQTENTYQLGPTKHFPVGIVNHILKDVLTNYLQEEQYEPELCRQMTKTISEVIKAQVKDLMIPRYKLIVTVHIGQLSGQSILFGSRCLWNPKSDNFSSYVFRNSSLFALANVYAVYFE